MSDVKHPHHRTDELAVVWVPADVTIPLETKVVENTWQGLYSLVGGYIEMVPQKLMVPSRMLRLDCLCPLVMIVHEDARMVRSQLNPRASSLLGIRAGVQIVGDAVLVAQGPVEGTFDFVSLLAGTNEAGIDQIKAYVDA
jgi:hypothetical protein